MYDFVCNHVYHNYFKMSILDFQLPQSNTRVVLSACQESINGWWGIECTSCRVNGAGKCDPDGCPVGTTYIEKDRKCECE